MIYSNEFFVVNKLLKKCWQHAYNHISPFYILECFMLWFGWQTTCSNHYVTQDLRASVLIIACLSPFLGLGYLPYIHYSYPLAFTDSLVSTMRSHAVLCFFQWETWHSLKNEKENYFKYKTWYWRQKKWNMYTLVKTFKINSPNCGKIKSITCINWTHTSSITS